MESKNLLPPFLLREILTISPFPVTPPPPPHGIQNECSLKRVAFHHKQR